jgi:2-iminobutanoate/2-iminopropanoate deaminase
MSKRVIHTDKAPAPFQGAPYSQAIVHDDLVFVAGQIGVDPQSNQVVDGGIEAQTDQIMKNIETILVEAGSSLANVLKASIFIVDFDDFPAMNQVYASYVGPDFPARATVQIAGLPSGALVEIEVIAHT